MKSYIKVVVCSDGIRSESTIKGPSVTKLMVEAAKELEYTMMTGERWVEDLPPDFVGAAPVDVVTFKPKKPKKPRAKTTKAR